MVKSIRKVKNTGKVAAGAEAVESSVGVRTRARAALQRPSMKVPAAPSGNGNTGYLQLRSRRLERTPMGDAKKQRPRRKRSSGSNPNPSGKTSSELVEETLKVTAVEEEKPEGKGHLTELDGSPGENSPELGGMERSQRETTPSDMIQVPESMRTPSSANRIMRPTEAQKRIRSAIQANAVVIDDDVDDYFGHSEKKQQKQFMEKYNFDPVKEEPLPGRYDWVKLKP